MMMLLDKDRIDVAVSDRIAGLVALQSVGIQGIGVVDTPLGSANFYHYLHRKNADFVPKIAEALAEMHASGRLRQLYDQYIIDLGATLR